MALLPIDYEALARQQLGLGEYECSCEWVDVLGPGYPLMRQDDPYCLSCNDPVVVMEDVDFDAYDPDMQENPPSEEDLQWIINRWFDPPTRIESRGW